MTLRHRLWRLLVGIFAAGGSIGTDAWDRARERAAWDRERDELVDITIDLRTQLRWAEAERDTAVKVIARMTQANPGRAATGCPFCGAWLAEPGNWANLTESQDNWTEN